MKDEARFWRRLGLDSFALLASEAWQKAIGAVTTLAIASALGPFTYGLLRAIDFLPNLLKQGSSNFDTLARREISHARASGMGRARESRVKNVAFSAAIAWSALLGAGVACAGLLFEAPELRFGLPIVGGVLLLAQIRGLYQAVAKVDRRFSLLAAYTAISTTAGGLFVIATVKAGGIYAALSGGVVGAAVGIVLYATTFPLDFRFEWSLPELRRQIKIAAPLAGGTAAFAAYKAVELWGTAAIYGPAVLGAYALVAGFVDLGLVSAHSVMQAASTDLYESLAHERGARRQRSLLTIPSLVFAVALAALGGLIWLIGPTFIRMFLPAFEDAILILPLLLPLWVFRSLSIIPMTAMSSAGLSMERKVPVVWVSALLVFGIVLVAGNRLGIGVFGPALASLAGSSVLALLSVYFVRRWAFVDRKAAATFALAAIGPLLYSAALVRLLTWVLPDPVPLVVVAGAFLAAWAPPAVWVGAAWRRSRRARRSAGSSEPLPLPEESALEAE